MIKLLRTLCSMLQFLLYEVPFGVDGLDENVLIELLGEKKLEFRSPSPGREASVTFEFRSLFSLYDLFQDGLQIATRQPLSLVFEMMFERTRLEVARSVTHCSFLRADAVGVAKREVIVICGPTFCGKTRLAQTFLSIEGNRSWSEHFAVLNETGEALPFPSPSVPLEGLPINALTKIFYQPDGEWSIEHLSPGKAVISLLPFVMGPENAAELAIGRLAKAATGAEVSFSGIRGEVELCEFSDILRRLHPSLAH